MRLYTAMQRFPWPKSYVGKLLSLCFVGTHIPLIALVVWAAADGSGSVTLPVFLIVLVATLIGTAGTLAALHSMISPITLSAKALEQYAQVKRLPSLPVRFEDEAGRLMASVQETVLALDDKLQELSRAASTDSLTGLRNRRWMNEVGIPDAERRQRKEETWSLIVIDLDEFKSINDTWGHSLGDSVLVATADAIRNAVRDSDFIVRTGGDEFCVLLPAADRQIVKDVAERLRRDAELASNSLDLERSVTVSIGAATARAEDSFLSVYRRADQNLYAAKESGRNMAVTDGEG